MGEQKGTRMHYVDQVEYNKTWKERLIYWGDRLREKVYRQKNEIATLQARIALLEKACEAAAWFYDNLKYPIRRDYKLEAALRAAGYEVGV